MANPAHALLKGRNVPRPRTAWLRRLETVWPRDASCRSPESGTAASEVQELLRQAEINGERSPRSSG